MQDALIYQLGDIAAEAQRQFQLLYAHIDPVIGINRQLREQGFAVDIMTIDCHVTHKRITLLLEDANPNNARYQFGHSHQDPASHFTPIALNQLNTAGFLTLMQQGLVAV